MSIVVLEERNKGCSDGGNLLRSDVHEVDLRGRNDRIVVVLTALNLGADEGTVIVEGCIALTDDKTILLFGRHVANAFWREVDLAVLYLTIGCLDEAQIVNLCIDAER